MVEVAAEDGRFFAIPARANTEQEAPAARIIKRRHLFCGEKGIALRNQTDPSAKFYPAGRRPCPRQRDQRVG